MFGIVNKIGDAFEDSGAKNRIQRKYKKLEKIHTDLTNLLHKLKQHNYEVLKGMTHDEVENQIQAYERKLHVIANKLEMLRKSIGGNY